MNDTTPTDGYGNPFPPHSQLFHQKCIQEFIGRCEQDKLIVTPPHEQCEWKDKPAGWWDKTPKDTHSLDG